MTLERKILLTILAFVLTAFALTQVHYVLGRKGEDLQEKYRLTKDQVDRLKSQEGTENSVENLERLEALRLFQYQDNTIELYPFGQEIKEQFEQLGLQIPRYQEITSGEQRAIEFHLQGEPVRILKFLNDSNTRKMRIESFTMDAQNSPASISIRIIPLTLPEEFPQDWKESLSQTLSGETVPPLVIDKEISPSRLSRIFPYTVVEVQAPTVEVEPVVQESKGPDRSSLSFVGKVSPQEGKELLYFKDKRNGRIFSLSPQSPEPQSGWRLVETTDSLYILENENNMYEVLR
ncbi:MAG: hypothetical protein PQJ60_13030 [Spirochaetales bacterium]|nr:hypothetical protein [Spirochaetales bacterium]